MTAQRTTLFSICLLAITLVFNSPNEPEPKIILLATNLKVDYQFALWAVLALILINGTSYIWRYWSDMLELDLEEIKSSIEGVAAANADLQNLEERMREIITTRERLGNFLEEIPHEIEETVKCVAILEKNVKKTLNRLIERDVIKDFKELDRLFYDPPYDVSPSLDQLSSRPQIHADHLARFESLNKKVTLHQKTIQQYRDTTDAMTAAATKATDYLSQRIVVKMRAGNTRDKIFDFIIPAVVSLLCSVLIAGKLYLLRGTF